MEPHEMVLASLPDGVTVISVVNDGRHHFQVRRDGHDLGQPGSLSEVAAIVSTITGDDTPDLTV